MISFDDRTIFNLFNNAAQPFKGLVINFLFVIVLLKSMFLSIQMAKNTEGNKTVVVLQKFHVPVVFLSKTKFESVFCLPYHKCLPEYA